MALISSSSLSFLLLLSLSLASCSTYSNDTIAEIEERDSDDCQVTPGMYVVDIPIFSGGVMFKARRGKCTAEIGIYLFCGCYWLSAVGTPTTTGVQVYNYQDVFKLTVLGTGAMGNIPVVLSLLDPNYFDICIGSYGGLLKKSENRAGINTFQAVNLQTAAGLCPL